MYKVGGWAMLLWAAMASAALDAAAAYTGPISTPEQAFNTFIDDVFSWVLTMPMSHRIACLRDDVVFFAYLYQRW